MRIFVLASCLTAATTVGVQAQDSLKVVNLSEAQVVTNRATHKTPIAFSSLGKQELLRSNFGQDIPFLLSSLPSVLTTSDAGTGVGYTSIRVRGTDGTRINITNNGIPLNDPEAHVLYWVDLPDFASSLQDIQVQRGVGTSTNGAGAFGASINMRSETISPQPFFEFNTSYGSFNTNKQTVKFGTGILRDRWILEGRLSHIGSDGYRDRAETEMGSYFVQAGYFSPQTTVKLITFGGKEKTYHAWDGVDKETLKTNRTYNPNGAIVEDGNVIGFYKNQNDYFLQNHYQILLTHRLHTDWLFNAALHYTYGKGSYEEYKNGRKLVEYGLSPYVLNGSTVTKSDLIREKYVRGNFGGGLFSFGYQKAQWDVVLGGAVNYFHNDHFGNVLWVKNYIGSLAPEHRYYDNVGRKLDGNVYARANYALLASLNLYADLQYRHIHYVISGANESYDANIGAMQPLDIHENFHFFNPKFGFVWKAHRDGQIYASFSVAHKEPTRNNYTEGFFTQYPKAERLFDYELGYRYTGPRWHFGANLYWMDYKDQLVLTGQLNEIGEAVAENVPKSYRTGLELEAGWKINEQFSWNANATFSKNRIKDYTAYLVDENWENLKGFAIGTTPISFSPTCILNNNFTFRHKQFDISLQSQYVSRQYLDNLGTKESSLDPYFISHLNTNYTFRMKRMKELTVGVTVYNLFDERYETNGYMQTTYNSADGSFNHAPMFYPMAGINFLAHLHLRF